jgi:hypothetical protein
MDAIRVHQVVEQDGEITFTGLPVEKGQAVEAILLVTPTRRGRRPRMTARDLLNSGLVGLWKDRDDIGDSVEFARELREAAQTRSDRE